MTKAFPDCEKPQSEKRRIGVLGGSFDPVHLGHKALAEAALCEAKLDMLIIMPAKVQPFKQELNVTCQSHREAMVRIAFSCTEAGQTEQASKIRISRYELNSEEALSYTIRTLKHINKEYCGAEIFFICGTDSYLSVEEWYKGPEILKNYSLIVSARPGCKEEELKRKAAFYKGKYGTSTVILRSEMPDISSTEIRRRIASEESVSELLPIQVERYIKENGLYK